MRTTNLLSRPVRRLATRVPKGQREAVMYLTKLLQDPLACAVFVRVTR